MKPGFGLVAVAILALMGATRDVGAQTFSRLGGLTGAGAYAVAYAVSGDGSAIMGRTDSAATANQAVFWRSPLWPQALPDLPGSNDQSSAYASNRDGSVIAGYGVPLYGFQEACVWIGGEPVPLGDLPGGGFASAAWGVSADGSVIAGYGQDDVGSKPVRWIRSADGTYSMSALSDVPGNYGRARGISADGSTIVGYGSGGGYPIAFRWSATTGMVPMGDLPGGADGSIANGADADGTVIVGYGTSASGQEAFRWTADGGMAGLGDLSGGAFASGAWATSADGAVVVGDATTSLGPEAFIWDAVHGMRNLRTVLESEYGLNLSGWVLETARSVSYDGKTVTGWGSYTDAGGVIHTYQGWVAYLGDTRAPAVNASLSPGPNGAGWNNSAVTITLTAADEAGGSGLQKITYSATGAQLIAETSTVTSPAMIAINTEGETTLTFTATDAAGNTCQPQTLIVKLDETPPTITAADVEAVATGPSTVVSFPAPAATDDLSGFGGDVVCSPPSGSAFPIGETTINCTVQDRAGNTSAATFKVVVKYPVPSISSLSPSSATLDGEPFALTVSGAGFFDTSIVRWNGLDRPTRLSPSGDLLADIPATDLALMGDATVTVFNPAPGGGESAPATFAVLGHAVPAVQKATPDTVYVGGPAFDLKVNGTGFYPGSVVRWNGQDRPTRFVSPTEVHAAIPSQDLRTYGTARITVYNAPPGGGESREEVHVTIQLAYVDVSPVACVFRMVQQYYPPYQVQTWLDLTIDVTNRHPVYGMNVALSDLGLSTSADGSGKLTGPVSPRLPYGVGYIGPNSRKRLTFTFPAIAYQGQTVYLTTAGTFTDPNFSSSHQIYGFASFDSVKVH